MSRLLYFIFSIFLFHFYSCTSNETGNSKEINSDAVFFDYRVRGEEKDSSITLYIQFKKGGPNGAALVLDKPARVQLDGEEIKVGSAKLTGAFYEIRKPSHSFSGKHTILFTGFDNRDYAEEFVYRSFQLKTKLPAIFNREDLAIDFEGLGPEDYIRVIAIDTSFTSRDINEIDTVMNGRLVIPASKLKNLVNGPIVLQLSRETERAVKNGTKVGGRIVVSYGLQREFELRSRGP
jgi:hypothetical protein